MVSPAAIASLSDAALLEHVESLAAKERRTTAALVASLAELDTRRLYLGAGCSSLFTYCTQVLHLSEGAAYSRIAAARCARRFPEILDGLSDGSLNLTTVNLLMPVMTLRNGTALLDRARHKSRRKVEDIVAELHPKPDVATLVRKAPAATGTHAQPPACDRPAAGHEPLAQPTPQTQPMPALLPNPAARPADVRPLSTETYKVQFTLSRRGYEQLCRAQDLLRHTIPNGDAGVIFERALSVLVERLETTKLAATVRPRGSPQTASKHSRHIPAAVTREVWRRDGGRCAYVGTQGRCEERGFIEFHHVIPFADGGETSAANLQLRCRAHNQYEATLWSGVEVSRLGPNGVGTGSAELESARGREPP
jgi:5-methylcytosine-specific restriction endonuclease McrA